MKKPSVTTLIGLLDKPALLSWANKQGLAGIDISQKRKEWLNDGISIHSQIENFVKNGEPFYNSDHEKSFKNFISDKKILGYEFDIETDWFVGRCDMKLEWNKKVYLIDFKNKSKGVYFENKLQLVAYGMAEKCDSFSIVSVPEFKMMNFTIKDRTPYEEILKSLSNIYKQKNIIDETKQSPI